MFYDELKNFIIEYGKKNGKLLQSDLIKSILDEKEEDYKDELPNNIQNIGAHKLSILTYNILIDSLKNNNERSISKDNLHLLIKKLLKEKFSKEQIRKIVLYTITGTMLFSGGVQVHKMKEKSTPAFSGFTIENRDYINMNPEFNRPSKKAIDKKQKRINAINNFNELNTLEDIYARQKSLELLNLTDEDKIYKDCPLSPEIQTFIYQLSISKGYPINLAFSIIDTETMGQFNSNGEISYNSSGNYDLGLTQQNSDYSIRDLFCPKYNIDFDEACELVRYNDYVNIVACFLKFDEIRNTLPENYDINEFAGYYNGWVNWKNNSISRSYVERFDEAYNKKFAYKQ